MSDIEKIKTITKTTSSLFSQQEQLCKRLNEETKKIKELAIQYVENSGIFTDLKWTFYYNEYHFQLNAEVPRVEIQELLDVFDAYSNASRYGTLVLYDNGELGTVLFDYSETFNEGSVLLSISSSLYEEFLQYVRKQNILVCGYDESIIAEMENLKTQIDMIETILSLVEKNKGEE